MGRTFWRDAMDAYRLGDAVGQEFVKQHDEQGLADAYKAGAGLGAASPADYRKYAEQFADNPEAAAAFTRAAEANYTTPTAQERRMAGLGSQSEYLLGQGKVKQASELLDQVDQMGLRQMQIEDARLGIDEKKRQAALRKAEEGVIAGWEKNPLERLKTQFNSDVGRFGTGNNAGKKANYYEIGDGSALVWDEANPGSAKVITANQLSREVERSRMADLAAVNPEKYLAQARQMNIKEDEIEMHRKHYQDQAANAERESKRKTIQDELEWGKGGWRDRYLGVLAAKGQGEGKPKDMTVEVFDADSGRSGKAPLTRKGDKYLLAGRELSEPELDELRTTGGLTTGVGKDSPYFNTYRTLMAKAQNAKTEADVDAFTSKANTAKKAHDTWVTNRTMDPQAAANELVPAVRRGLTPQEVLDNGYSPAVLDYFAVGANGKLVAPKGLSQSAASGAAHPDSPYAKAQRKLQPGHTLGLVDIAREAF